MRFSERLGYKKSKMELQIDKVDEALKAGLWNCIDLAALGDKWISDYQGGYSDQFETFTLRMWHSFFNLPVDTRPRFASEAKQKIRDHFFSSDFPETYDVLEFIGCNIDGAKKKFHSLCNKVLEREKSAFRFVGGQLILITDETELAEIEQAVEQTQSETVSKHLGKAVSFYSNRENPDYPNAITESIKAVEEAARLLTGDKNATLGGAIKKLKADGRVHTAFADGVSKLFGWTSDTMRHAAKGQAPETSEAEARFMLVNCSAMANYLLSLSEET